MGIETNNLTIIINFSWSLNYSENISQIIYNNCKDNGIPVKKIEYKEYERKYPKLPGANIEMISMSPPPVVNAVGGNSKKLSKKKSLKKKPRKLSKKKSLKKGPKKLSKKKSTPKKHKGPRGGVYIIRKGRKIYQ